MVDLALNAVELDRSKPYERTCDVRWWATDSPWWIAPRTPNAANVSYVAKRLAVILRAYTVYLDLWLCDPRRQCAGQRPVGPYGVKGANVAAMPGFPTRSS